MIYEMQWNIEVVNKFAADEFVALPPSSRAFNFPNALHMKILALKHSMFYFCFSQCRQLKANQPPSPSTSSLLLPSVFFPMRFLTV